MTSSQQQLFAIETVKTSRHRNRKNHNQYFTPEFAVEKALALVPMADVQSIIDPSVGNGMFLKVASKRWSNARLYGVDIDALVIGDLKSLNLPNSIYFTGDSLLKETWEETEIKEIISDGGFDLVIGNPPFSSWFHRVESQEILANYRLAHRNGRNGKLMRSQAIEVLFIEIFVRLAREEGYIVIVLPEGILSNPQYKYVREFILTETKVKYIINLKRYIFSETSAKTSILILQKERTDSFNYSVKLYDLEKTGVINNAIEVKGELLRNRQDYWYYRHLKENSLQELVNNSIEFVPLRIFMIFCKTGKTLYGKERKFSEKGRRFLHATNITEIGINYKKDEKFIDSLSKMNFLNAHARIGDILFVRVGVGCAGRVAIVDTQRDEGVATDYIHILSVKDINPYFLVVYLKTRLGKDSINLLKHGVGTVSINKSDLLSIPIPIVPKECQIDVAERYKYILSKYREEPNDPKIKEDLDLLILCLENKIRNLKSGEVYVEM